MRDMLCYASQQRSCQNNNLATCASGIFQVACPCLVSQLDAFSFTRVLRADFNARTAVMWTESSHKPKKKRTSRAWLFLRVSIFSKVLAASTTWSSQSIAAWSKVERLGSKYERSKAKWRNGESRHFGN